MSKSAGAFSIVVAMSQHGWPDDVWSRSPFPKETLRITTAQRMGLPPVKRGSPDIPIRQDPDEASTHLKASTAVKLAQAISSPAASRWWPMNRQPYDDDFNDLRAALNERAAESATY